MSSPQILLVEDDAALCISLADMLTISGYRVSSFDSGQALLRHLEHKAEADEGPVLVLIDLQLRGESGLTVQKTLSSLGIDWPVVFMSAHMDAKKVNQAWLGGASNFLFKPFTSEELLTAIRRALSDAGVAAQQAASLSPEIREKFALLTPRQIEVLKAVANGQSNTAIAVQMAISTRTVKMHRESMMQRLGFGHVTELVRFHDACKDLF